MNYAALRKMNAARYAKHMETKGVDVLALVPYRAKRPLPNQCKARAWSKSGNPSAMSRGMARDLIGYAGN